MEIEEVLKIELDNCRRRIIQTYTELQEKRENKEFGYTKQINLLNELHAQFVRLDIIYTYKRLKAERLINHLHKDNELNFKVINEHINKIDHFIYCENAIDEIKRNIIIEREIKNLQHIIKEATENDWENYNGHYLFDEKR